MGGSCQLHGCSWDLLTPTSQVAYETLPGHVRASSHLRCEHMAVSRGLDNTHRTLIFDFTFHFTGEIGTLVDQS